MALEWKTPSPIRRTKEEDLLRASSVANYGRQKYNSIPNYKNNENHEYATLIEERDTYYGMNAEINMWNPQVQEQNGFSLAQFWKEGINNNGVTLYTIEASAMYATLIEERDTYYGMNAEINMWNPQVQEQNGFSLAQFWKEGINNNGVTLYTIEASAMAHAKH
ncbi:hypothetical protein CFP56_017129 [Quercus suber]|uniref:Neprosin PEP catalytic domain-containing protein n=1 Tax=Quercus suber TaxID=58331 RepID=A0AAW0M1T7_QUESU